MKSYFNKTNLDVSKDLILNSIALLLNNRLKTYYSNLNLLNIILILDYSIIF